MLEAKVDCQADIDSNRALLRDQLKVNEEAREKLRNEFEEATDYIIELEEKLFKANKLAVQMAK